jgi:hypothetical protein
MNADSVAVLAGNGGKSKDTPSNELELAGYLMARAVRAAILLIEDEEPALAADVLRLGRDRFEPVFARVAGVDAQTGQEVPS